MVKMAKIGRNVRNGFTFCYEIDMIWCEKMKEKHDILIIK